MTKYCMCIGPNLTELETPTSAIHHL